MKKSLFIITGLCAFLQVVYGQIGTTAKSEYTQAEMPQSNKSLKIISAKAPSALKGENQWGEIRIINTGSVKIEIHYDVVVTTVCGTTKTSNFWTYLEPGDNSDGVIWVSSTDCFGTKLTDTKSMLSGTVLDDYNRIKSVGYRNLTFSVIRNPAGDSKPTAESAANNVPATITPSISTALINKPVAAPAASNAITPAMQQLQQTKNYANSHVGLPQTQSVSQSIRDFGSALSNYQASRQRDREHAENRRLEGNQKAADYISCISDKEVQQYYAKDFTVPYCNYGGNSANGYVSNGKLDSVNFYYNNANYLAGTRLISDETLRNAMADPSSTDPTALLNAGNIVSNVHGLFVFTSYMGIYDYDYKARNDLRKSLDKGEYSSKQILGAGISSLLYTKKDTAFAAYCFRELLKTNSPAYFKKSAYLFLGLIKKNQAIRSGNNDLLTEAFSLLDKSYAISESQFLKIGSSYSNDKYTDNYSGLFVYPEYDRLLQVAALQEISNCLFWKYKLTGNAGFLKMTFKYFYGFFDAIKAEPEAEYVVKSFSEKEQKKISDLYHKARKNEKEGKKTEAFQFYKEAAEMGDADSQFSVGDAYEEGEGVEKNLPEAIRWYDMAAKQGDYLSQFALGTNYYFGDGIAKNPAESIKWGLKSANQGFKGAQYFIGMMYQNGEGVAKDKDEAMLWFMKAAGQGHVKAKAALERLTAEGK
jgi:hypothetical protein